RPTARWESSDGPAQRPDRVLEILRVVLPDRPLRGGAPLHLLALEQEVVRPGRAQRRFRGWPPMSVGERDPHTGHMTTGHEWNGIKELNTPVPKPVWFFLISAFLFGVGYWILMPAWPYGVDYTRGLLGFDQRQVVTEKVAAAAAA